MSFRNINESFNRMFEGYLIEDIESAKRQYSHIPEADFDKIIRLDPTFDENRNVLGNYGNWLLGKYKKDNPLMYDPQEVYNTLSAYDEKKKDKRHWNIDTNMNGFKTLNDFKDAVENATEKELSKRQSEKERNKKSKSTSEYTCLAECKNYDIYTPLSFEGETALGYGTDWCTAKQETYYKHYAGTYGGKYYVLIRNDQELHENPKDRLAKLQFHFESIGKQGGCLAADDEPLDAYGTTPSIEYEEFFDDNSDIESFFDNEGYSDDVQMLRLQGGGYSRMNIDSTLDAILVPDNGDPDEYTAEIDYQSLYEVLGEGDMEYYGWLTMIDIQNLIAGEYGAEEINDIFGHLFSIDDLKYSVSEEGGIDTDELSDMLDEIGEDADELYSMAFAELISDNITNYYLENFISYFNSYLLVDGDSIYLRLTRDDAEHILDEYTNDDLEFLCYDAEELGGDNLGGIVAIVGKDCLDVEEDAESVQEGILEVLMTDDKFIVDYINEIRYILSENISDEEELEKILDVVKIDNTEE